MNIGDTVLIKAKVTNILLGRPTVFCGGMYGQDGSIWLTREFFNEVKIYSDNVKKLESQLLSSEIKNTDYYNYLFENGLVEKFNKWKNYENE